MPYYHPRTNPPPFFNRLHQIYRIFLLRFTSELVFQLVFVRDMLNLKERTILLKDFFNRLSPNFSPLFSSP